MRRCFCCEKDFLKKNINQVEREFQKQVISICTICLEKNVDHLNIKRVLRSACAEFDKDFVPKIVPKVVSKEKIAKEVSDIYDEVFVIPESEE